MSEIRIVTDRDVTVFVKTQKPDEVSRLEGLGSNLDGRMFVDETSGADSGKQESITNNLPHGMSPADL